MKIELLNSNFMNNPLQNTFLFVVVLFIVTSCNKNRESDQLITLYDSSYVDIPFPDTTDIVSSDSTKFHAQRVGGYSAKHWGKVFKHCLQNALVKKGDADYLGNDNSLSVGYVTDLNMDNPLDKVDLNTFTKDELLVMIDTGKAYATCNFVVTGKLDISAIAGGEVSLNNASTPLDVELQAAIKTNRDVEFKVKRYKKKVLFINRLMQALADTSNVKKRDFRKLVLSKENQIMTIAVIIKGFEAEIKLGKDISPGLRAHLSTDSTASVGNLSIDAKVKVVNTKTLKISADDEIVLFGKFSQVTIK